MEEKYKVHKQYTMVMILKWPVNILIPRIKKLNDGLGPKYKTFT